MSISRVILSPHINKPINILHSRGFQSAGILPSRFWWACIQVGLYLRFYCMYALKYCIFNFLNFTVGLYWGVSVSVCVYVCVGGEPPKLTRKLVSTAFLENIELLNQKCQKLNFTELFKLCLCPLDILSYLNIKKFQYKRPSPSSFHTSNRENYAEIWEHTTQKIQSITQLKFQVMRKF